MLAVKDPDNLEDAVIVIVREPTPRYSSFIAAPAITTAYDVPRGPLSK